MSCSVPDAEDIDFIMSVQHQLQSMELKSDVETKDDRWNSAPKSRTPGRWLSESSLSVNNKSQNEPPRRPRKNHREPGRWASDSRLSVNYKAQLDPPRRPMKNDAEPISGDDFRWKDCECDKPSALIPIQPKRRKSIGKLVDDFQDVLLSMNYQISQDHQGLHRLPNIHAAFSA
jgi:hypothetical protein